MLTRSSLGTMVRICPEHSMGVGYLHLVVAVKSDKQRLW